MNLLKQLISLSFLLISVWGKAQTVTLTVDKTTIAEGDSATITATLSTASTSETIISFASTGGAVLDGDYEANYRGKGVVTTVAGGNGQGSAANQIYNPIGLAVDLSGNLYINEHWNYRISKWAPGASEGIIVAGGNGQGSAANQLDYVFDITVDSEGNIYAADGNNGRVQKWTPGASEGITVADNLSNPYGVAVDASGNVYASDQNNHRILKWIPGDSEGIVVAGGNGSGNAANQLSYPKSVEIDIEGNLLVADAGNNRIQKFSLGSSISSEGITLAGGDHEDFSKQLNDPWGMAIDGFNNLYIADRSNHRIQKWAPGASEGITIKDELLWIQGVAVDSYGNIYYPGPDNNILQILREAGIIISAGQTTGTLTVKAILDDLEEADETIILTPTVTGATLTSSDAITLTIDDNVPTITGVTSTTSDGSYKQGDVIAITVGFSEVVNVTGTPQLTLETGSGDAVVNYSSGSGSNILTFNYTIGSGETSDDLDYVATNSLALNSGTIKDAAGNAATLTLASPGAANSLGANKELKINADNQNIPNYVPSEGLISWYPFNGNANDESGSGNNGVVSGATLSADANGNANSAYTFNGSSDYINIPNEFANGQTLSSQTFHIKFRINQSGTYTLWNKDGSWREVRIDILDDNSIGLFWAFPNYYSSIRTVTNSIALEAWNDVVIIVADDAASIFINGIKQLSYQDTDSYNNVSSSNISYGDEGSCGTQHGNNRFGFVKWSCSPKQYYLGDLDAFALWNRALTDDEIAKLYAGDDTPPKVKSVTASTVDGAYKVGDEINITVIFDKVVIVTGTPQLTLETGSSDAVVDYTSGSGTTTLSFNYTVSEGQISGDLDYVSTSSLALNGGTIKATGGTSVATLTLPSPGALNSLGANKALVINLSSALIVSKDLNDFNSITAAYNQANEGDIILVKEGTYFDNVKIEKRVYIISESGPFSTIIKPNDDALPIFSFLNGSGKSLLEGFTIEDGGEDAIDLRLNYDTTFINRSIIKNTSYAAVKLYGATGFFENTIFMGNGTVISEQPGAGAVFLNCNILNSTFQPPVTNSKPFVFLNCNFDLEPSGNIEVHYSNVRGDFVFNDGTKRGTGNINVDPLFLDNMVPSESSPLIDAGTDSLTLVLDNKSYIYAAPRVDILNNKRPMPEGSSFDIGVYETSSQQLGLDPTLTITARNDSGVVLDSTISNDSQVVLTFTTSQATTNFTVDDILVTNGTLSNFTAISSTIYTTNLTPLNDGSITVNVPMNVFTDALGNSNTTSDQFNWIYDGTPPNMTISVTNGINPLSDGAVTADTSLIVTFTTNEPIINLNLEDIIVEGGGFLSFTKTNASIYTGTFAPYVVSDTILIKVLSSVFTDLVGNTNTSMSQFNWIYDPNEEPIILTFNTTFPENIANGFVIGIIEAIDPDDDVLSFNIISGNEKGAFMLDSISGQLAVLDNVPLDFEINPSFELMISVSDGFHIIYATINISLSDVLENEDDETTLSISKDASKMIYPNPAIDIINIEMTEFKEATIYNLSGRKVLRSNDSRIDVNSLIEGVYIIELENNSGERFSTKLIKD